MRQHTTDLEPPFGRLGKTPGRCRRRQRDARPGAPSRPRSQVWTSKLADQDRAGLVEEQELSLMRGLCPRAPGIYRFPPEWLPSGAACAAPPFRTRIGALVASPRCHILRPGLASINPLRAGLRKMLAETAIAGL